MSCLSKGLNKMNQFDDWLQHALEQRLGSFVEEKILAIQNLDSKTLDSLGDELVHVVCRSQEMSEFRNNILHQDCDVLSLDGEDNAAYDGSLNDTVALSGCSSTNVTPRKETGDDGFTISERRARTSSQRSTNQRMQALELLLKVPISDIVGSANWPHLQQELCESLCDENWSVFMQVLRVLTRLSSSSLFSPVREGFLSVLEGLTLYYLTRNLHQQLPSTLHGVQLKNPVHRRIVLTSQCLLQILNVIPGKWIRYGEKRTQEIVDNFVDLLSMHTHHHRTLTVDHSKDILYPFHMFSILDPEAKWCEGIMHAAFGRTILMKCVMKSSSLIRFIVEEVIIWLKCQMKLSEGVTLVHECGTNGNINGNMINLSVFVHCVSLLKMFVNCERGHLLFPVLTSIQEEAVSIYSLLLKILEFLNRVASEPNMHHSERIQKMLENVCATLILSRGTRILHGSSLELIHQLMEVQNRTDHFSLHTHNVNILYKISESPIAIRWMLGRPARRTRDGLSRAFSDLRVSLSSASSSGRESVLTNRTACVARKIAKATTVAVRDRNRFTSESTSPASMLLSLSERLFSTPEGYLLLESCESQLIPLAGHLLMHIRNMMYNSDLGLLSMQQSLESFLLGMTLTPMGFLAVSSVENLLNCLVACYLESPLTNRYNEPIFLHLFQLLTSEPNLKLQVHRKNLMKHALLELWAAQESVSGWDWEEAKNRFTSIVLAVCSTPSAVADMLAQSDPGDDSSESTLVEEIQPLSFREFFLSGLQSMCDTSSGQIQEIFFKVLHLLSHNIDLALQLQENLNLSDCLQRVLNDAMVKESCNELTVQPSPRRDKSNTNIIDEDARTCSHILTIIHQLRDPSPCNLSTWFNCGGPRSPRTAYTSRARIQTDLQRFLQDTRHGLHDNMWISHARRAYRASCRSDLKVPVLMDLLDQVLQTHPALSTTDTALKWPTRNAYPSHSEQHLQAIDTVIRFGCQIKSLNANMMNTHAEQLALLLHQTEIFLSRQKTDSNFDWFAASVFLMCAGNVDRSRSVLQRVAMLPNGSFIWPMLSQNTTQLAASINQHLQGLLAEFLPKAYHALQGAGIPWWLVAERLTQQAFMPSIPLAQLPHMLAITALHSWEYNLYMQAAILAHIQPAVLEISPPKSIPSLLMDLKLDNFYLGDYIPFMDKLAKLNRPYLVRDRIATATI
ncbi:protein broad-minded-like [Thrips palmi]|uniref:Protein broad-minded-like n=1 Tax=Thrips palmi TaxID=161013 RepID=A0A6P8Z5L8_THRPL|nr:protein broad-minded-like [Thrips palmi]